MSLESEPQVQEIHKFLEFIFRKQSGYVYLASKDPETHKWIQYFFEWPVEQTKLVEVAINLNESGKDIFYSPSLFVSREATKVSWKGTYVQWCEFDAGSAPRIPKGPIPSVILQSSTEGNEHWYFQLNSFQTDRETIEKINERLAYGLGADRSGWDANQVLRLPTLLHQKKHLRSKLLSFQSELIYDTDNFNEIPEPPPRRSIGEIPPVGALPSVPKIVAKYRWSDDAFRLFSQDTIEVGNRSSMLTKIGYYCLEMGMEDLETLAILADVDNRWGKFKERDDRILRLHGIIVYCKSRIKQKKEDLFQAEGLQTFLKRTTSVQWIVDGLIYKKSLTVLAGPPGIGKSLLSLQFCIQAGLGGHWLKWKVNRPQRMLFLSMEMSREELKSGLVLMTKHLLEPELDQLDNNFQLVPVGAAIHISSLTGQEVLYSIMEKYKPDGLVIDSLGMAVGKISDDNEIKRAFDFIDNGIRNEFGSFVIFIHHPRKSQVGNKRPKELDDLYGNRYITQSASTVLGLWPTSSKNVFQMNFLKTRLGNMDDFVLLRREPSTLITSVHSIGESSIKSTSKSDKRGLLET